MRLPDDNGVCTFDPKQKKFTRYPAIANNGMMNSNGKLDDVSVQAIYEDKQGTIWIGTNIGGLNRFDPATGKFKSFLFDGQRRVMCVTKIFEDSRGRLWVGTPTSTVWLNSTRKMGAVRQSQLTKIMVCYLME